MKPGKYGAPTRNRRQRYSGVILATVLLARGRSLAAILASGRSQIGRPNLMGVRMSDRAAPGSDAKTHLSPRCRAYGIGLAGIGISPRGTNAGTTQICPALGRADWTIENIRRTLPGFGRKSVSRILDHRQTAFPHPARFGSKLGSLDLNRLHEGGIVCKMLCTCSLWLLWSSNICSCAG